MNNFLRNFITEWRRLDLPFSGETFVVAVSGGADSVSLLLALKELREMKKLDLRFVIAHFNHQLRGEESNKDEEFVRRLTTEYGFELAIGHGPVSHEGNLEQNARTARYEFLTQTAENLNAAGVLTAHTINDQAETFLINLIRGSGVDGLSGMKTVRSLKSKVQSPKSDEPDPVAVVQESLFDEGPLLIRPLLTWAKRIDTENFCHELDVEYRYDTMNEDLAFKRVRVRKVLLPMLEEMNPKIVETLAQTAALLRLETERKETKMEESAKKDGSQAVPDGALSLKELKLIETPELYNKLRGWLGERRGNLRRLELKHIEAIERLIHSKKSGKTIELPGGDTVVKRRGMIMFVARSGQNV